MIPLDVSGDFKPVVQCPYISIDTYVRRVRKVLKEDLLRMSLEADGVKVGLIKKEMHHGGSRYYFACPVCTQRVVKLYFYRGVSDLCCSKCLDVYW